MSILSQLSAAPHSPAGAFSPYSDWEKGDGRNLGAHPAALEIGETLSEGALLPVAIRGEVPGGAMRGGAAFLHEGRQS